ncbi:tail protein X, partial [Bosea sp. TAB14]
MRVQVTRENMTLDLVVWEAFGRQDPGVVEQAFALNPGLAALG